ncbi:hypothetical protein DENSPDRAFT_835444 [Dentipellis sp. KUC8613]|nr:hypothetical protein DENSPDRAFT_835444 [Dentipellis sp. KUC8613]
MEDADSLEALSNLLTALADSPYDYSLHVQHINLANQTGLIDQIQDARDMMTKFWACTDDIWLPFIEAKEKAVDLDTSEGVQEVLDLYERAENDYMFIPILRRHIKFLIAHHARLLEVGTVPDDPEQPFSSFWTREAIAQVVAKGLRHLTNGSELWNLQRNWEVERLEAASGEEKLLWIGSVEQLHLERLQQPHSDHEETFQSYSSFTTNHKPPQEYEELLVAASQIRSKAVSIYEWREKYETSLAQANYSLAAYEYYIEYERRARKPDLSILSTIYERAIAEAAKRRHIGEPGAEEALTSFWLGYSDAMRIHKADQDTQLSIFRRAARSIPGSGELWAKHIRFLESNLELVDAEQAESIPDIYDRAMGTGLPLKDPENIVPIVLARAGYEMRRILAWDTTGEPDALPNLYELLENGMQLARAASKMGDPRFRLEKFTADLRAHFEEYDEAAEVWEDAARHYRTNYLAWIAYTDALRRSDVDAARSVFRDISNRDMDWPEAIWEAWIAFEHAKGTVSQIEACLDIVERARSRVNAKRAKEAERASYQAMQIAAEQQAAQVPVAATSVPESTEASDAPMDVDGASQTTERSLKRKAEEPISNEEIKKSRIEPSQPLKRDRENCTVFVGDLPSTTSDDDLKALFKDCGKIREVKITHLPNAVVATVEFMERDSVPAALTKDKKRVHEQEIAVHLAWQSTLYVTNFPEKADDAFVRNLFGKYGLIFDVRWPSKKFKSTRRFCYVQFTSPSSAKASLELHGKELEPDMPLSVYISNPERKKDRTDADANAREIYIAGLSRFATKEDLEKLFKTYGEIKDVRMALDAQNHSKGFAFVEFVNERDAAAALNANNYELKKRRIAVTLADTRVRSRKREPDSGLGKRADARNRSLRIQNLPAGTQEGLLQQTLEKHGAVARVEVFEDKNEAIVEFQTPADAGKLLLLPEPIIFNGNPLQLSEGDASSTARGGSKAPAAAAPFIPRAAVSRPRAGLGHARKPAPVAAGNTGSAAPVGSSQPPAKGKGQDDFRSMLAGGK